MAGLHFLLRTLESLVDKFVEVNGICQIRGCQIMTVLLGLLDEGRERVDSLGLGIGHLHLVQLEHFHILVKILGIDLLLAVLVV